MLAGMSGATAGSGGALGPDENDGRLMLPHAPRNTAMAEAIPRLRTARVLFELIMTFSPNQTFGRIPSRSQAQNSGRSNHVWPVAELRYGLGQASYIGLTKALSPWHDRTTCQAPVGGTISTRSERLPRLAGEGRGPATTAS